MRVQAFVPEPPIETFNIGPMAERPRDEFRAVIDLYLARHHPPQKPHPVHHGHDLLPLEASINFDSKTFPCIGIDHR